VQASQPSKEFK